MTTQAGGRRDIDQAESPYQLITTLAAGASPRALGWLLGSALAVVAGLLLATPRYWPLAALAGTLGLIALWGLLAHRVEHRRSGLLLAVQRLLVVLGALLALGGFLAIFFAMLGPRWML